ncbi:hypothetical protein BVX93_00460, partial [bacterium B13(2017)]
SMDVFYDELQQRKEFALEGKSSKGYQLGTISGVDSQEGRVSLFDLAQKIADSKASAMGVENDSKGAKDAAKSLDDMLRDFGVSGINTDEKGKFVKTSVHGNGVILQSVEMRVHSEYTIKKGKYVVTKESYASVMQPGSMMRNVANYKVFDKDGNEIKELSGNLTDEELNQFINSKSGKCTIRGNEDCVLVLYVTKDGYTSKEGVATRQVRSDKDQWGNLDKTEREALIFGGGTFLSPELIINGRHYDISEMSLDELELVFSDPENYGLVLDKGKVKVMSKADANAAGLSFLDLDEVYVNISMKATNDLGGSEQTVIKVSLADLLYKNKETGERVPNSESWNRSLANFILTRKTDFDKEDSEFVDGDVPKPALESSLGNNGAFMINATLLGVQTAMT